MLVIDQLLHQNIFIRRNNNFILDIQYKPKGVVFDTSNIIRTYMQIRPYKNSNTLFIQLSNYDKVITYTGSDGGIHLNIPYSVTRDLPKFDSAYYDIMVYTIGNVAKTIMEGEVQIEKSVGRVFDGPVSDSSGSNNNLGAGYVPVWDDILEKPEFAKVAVTGSYNDLSNKPSLFDGKYATLLGKPNLSTVAISGSYNDLTDKPTIKDNVKYSYNDLTDKPNPLVFKGTWNPTISYFINNVVYYNKASYICLIANSGINPYTNNATSSGKVWQIIAGDDGNSI